MRALNVLAALVTIVSSAPSVAGITSVTTQARVTTMFRADVFGNPIIDIVEGPVLGGNTGGSTFGAGSSYETTSLVDPDYIYFKNANAAAGRQTSVESYTIVTIGLRNTSETSLRPRLDSTIIPAGMGLYVGPNCLNVISSCGPDTPVTGPPRGFDNFEPSRQGDNRIAGSSFDFVVRNGSTILYELQGSVGYAFDPVTGTKSLVTDLGAAENALVGFRLVTPSAASDEFAFQWDATPISLQFADLIAPGAETFLTYETRVTSYAFAECTTLLTGICLNSFAAFGDPLGKGSTGPSFRQQLGQTAAAMTADELTALRFDEFRFGLPTFERGVLAYQPVADAVPEPANWAMFVVGFGMLGGMMRFRPICSAGV
jgi:hypothetical protein